MMLKKVGYNDGIKALLEKEPIINLNIVGALNYEEDPAIYVDDEENPTGVYIKIEWRSYLYTQNTDFVDQVLQQFEDKEFCFSGVKRDLVDYMRGKHEIIWENPCNIYYYPHKEIDLSEVKSEVVTIPLEEAQHIDNHYAFRGEGSLAEMQDNLSRRPSAGVYVDGELVCWVLVHEDDSMGVMYTMEGHRRNGYAVDVTLVLMDQLLKLGKTPFIQIIETNPMSPGLAAKSGFIQAGKCSWFGLRK